MVLSVIADAMHGPMAEMKRPTVTQINVVARHYAETLQFYRLLGLDVPDPVAQPPGALHAAASHAGIQFEIDNEFLARIYNAGWRRSGPMTSLLITVSVATRKEVDAIYAKLVASGAAGVQAPYDAFWGSRFAVVADPEGNNVGLMSPPDARHKSWPPTESPSSQLAQAITPSHSFNRTARQRRLRTVRSLPVGLVRSRVQSSCSHRQKRTVTVGSNGTDQAPVEPSIANLHRSQT